MSDKEEKFPLNFDATTWSIEEAVPWIFSAMQAQSTHGLRSPNLQLDTSLVKLTMADYLATSLRSSLAFKNISENLGYYSAIPQLPRWSGVESLFSSGWNTEAASENLFPP